MSDLQITDVASWTPVVIPQDGKNLDQAALAGIGQQLANRDAYLLNRIKNAPYGKINLPTASISSANAILPDSAQSGVTGANQRVVYNVLQLTRTTEWQAGDVIEVTSQFDFTQLNTALYDWSCAITIGGYADAGTVGLSGGGGLGSGSQFTVAYATGSCAVSGGGTSANFNRQQSVTVHGNLVISASNLALFPLNGNVQMYSVFNMIAPRYNGALYGVMTPRHYSPSFTFRIFH